MKPSSNGRLAAGPWEGGSEARSGRFGWLRGGGHRHRVVRSEKAHRAPRQPSERRCFLTALIPLHFEPPMDEPRGIVGLQGQRLWSGGTPSRSDDRLARRFVRHENSVGEWSLADLDFGYRVCAFNPAAHRGVHVHGPEGAIQPIDIRTPMEAERIVKAYSRAHPRGFDWATFRRFVKRWRSE